MMERRAGIEPASLAWKAEALTRVTSAAISLLVRRLRFLTVTPNHHAQCLRYATWSNATSLLRRGQQPQFSTPISGNMQAAVQE